MFSRMSSALWLILGILSIAVNENFENQAYTDPLTERY